MTPIYSFLGLVVGLTFLAAGCFCMVRSASGRTNMNLTLWGLKLQVETSLPGIIFAVLGLLVIFVTSPG